MAVSVISSVLTATKMSPFSIFSSKFYRKKWKYYITRGGSRAATTSKMEHFVIIFNGFQPLTIIAKRSILDVAAALDPSLKTFILALATNDFL